MTVPGRSVDPPVAQVLADERAYLEVARGCLITMRESAERIADYGVDELASHALGRLRADRLESLAADPDAPPFFGRTDRDTETFHIGRRHLRNESGDPIVIDWRAPISQAFYRATATDRQGVRLRRRFGFSDSRLTSFEDEHLDRGEALGLESGLLREEIERPRVGPMRDIVATIQPDQDELVRADLDHTLCIQGAPGTGKTAVGLHRAAFLLYTYPERLRRSGVLVVGPNKAFLHYIAQVLPALGELGIEQATVEDLVAHAPVGAEEDVAIATLKGDPRMAEVLRRAVYSHVTKPEGDVVAIVATKRYRISEQRLRRYVDDVRRLPIHWASARERLRTQLAEDVRRRREDAGGAPSDAETARVARSVPVREFVDQVWPALDPRALLARLYADPDFRRRCAPALDEAELARLQRPAPKAVRSIRWTMADTVLLDELVGLIDGVDSFVHAVVDEAQDLSAMQCRAIARRCPLGAMTVLGDLAQATTPWAPGDWASTLEHLGQPSAPVRPLTVGYRVPGEVLELANRLLPHIAAEVPPATSIRAGRDALAYRPRAELLAAVRDCLAEEGSVGVIVRDVDVAAMLLELAEVGAEHLDAGDDARLTVVPASAAKGLEFDSVLVLEPSALVAAEGSRTAGLRRLYVALTRAVSRLVIVHDEALPPELTNR